MPNSIKYSTSAQTLALKKGNYWIGTGDVAKGPTSTTDYWNGITPPSGGYTIYLNKASGGPSIYTAANDSQLISLSNAIAGQTFATAAAALDWFATQTDKMVFNIDYGPIVTDGLILNLDAGFTPSYPTTGTTLYDLAILPSISPANGTLLNGPTFNSANSGSLVFDGVDDQVRMSQIFFNSTTLNNLTAITVEIWIKPPTSPTQYGGYISRQTSATSNYTGWSIRQNNLNNGAIEWFGFGANANMITGNVTPNAWTLATGTWNGTVMTLYINGSQASTRTNSVNTISATGQLLTIGKLSYGNFPQTFSMASARIYNRALTAAEVLQNYNAQKSRFGL